MSNMSGMQKNAVNKLLQKRYIPMPMLQKRNNIPMLMKGLMIRLHVHMYRDYSEDSFWGEQVRTINQTIALSFLPCVYLT